MRHAPDNLVLRLPFNMSSLLSKIPGLHFSHMRSTGSGDRVLRDPVFSNKGPSESANRNSASPERRKADGTR